jgi:hypothetical protein
MGWPAQLVGFVRPIRGVGADCYGRVGWVQWVGICVGKVYLCVISEILCSASMGCAVLRCICRGWQVPACRHRSPGRAAAYGSGCGSLWQFTTKPDEAVWRRADGADAMA